MSYLARLKALNSEKRHPGKLQKVQEGAFCSSCTTAGRRFSKIEATSAVGAGGVATQQVAEPRAQPVPERHEAPADLEAALDDAFAGQSAIAEHAGRQPRAEAERIGTAGIERERAIVRWLNAHPPAVTDPGTCAYCRLPERREAALLPFLAGDDTHRWVHAACWPDWHQARRLAAESALAAHSRDRPAA